MAIDPSMTVLIVDDDDAMAAVVRKLLAQIDLSRTDEASDGTAALARLREGDFGLVISDCDMEPMGGVELLETMRDDDRLKAIPVILMTGDVRTDLVREAKAAGAAAVLIKPFGAAALAAEVHGIFGRSVGDR